MWRVFWSTTWCWRGSGILLWDISLLKPDDEKAGPKNVWWWRPACDSRQFFNMALKDQETILDCKEINRSAWIVPAHFCYIQFINNSCYLSGDTFTAVQRCTQPRENNVSFVQISSHNCAQELKNYQIFAVKALRNIDLREDLYKDYGSAYRPPELYTQYTKASVIS